MTTLHIFPSRSSAEDFSLTLVKERGVLCGAGAVTLKDLTRDLAKGEVSGRRILSTVGVKLLLDEVIEREHGTNDTQFSRISGFPGFAGAVETLFGELKQAGVSPTLLEGYATASDEPGIREIASLFARYTALLQEKDVLDPHDFELAAIARLQQDSLPEWLSGVSSVTVHHIYDLSTVQLALLAALSLRLPIELRLPYEPGLDRVYGYVSRTADAIEALDDPQLNINPVFCGFEGRFVSPLLKAVYSRKDGQAHPPPEEISLVSASGAYAECEEIGRRIRSLIEEGIDPADIAVLCRSLTRHGPMLEDVFRRFGLPLSFRRGAPLSSAPLVRAALSPFALSASGIAREDVVAFCACSYFSPPGGLPSPAEVDEVLSRAGYITEAFGSAPEKIVRLIERMEHDGSPATLAKRVLGQLRPVLATVASFSRRNTLSGFTALLEDFVQRYGIYRQGIAASDERALKRDASAIMHFQKVLTDLKTDAALLSLEGREFAPADYLHLLHQGMEGTFLAGERDSGVSVLNFHDARGRAFDHVFIAGLNEDICPQRHESHPLLKDTHKVLLRRRLGLHSLRTAKEKAEEEPLLFWMAIATACTSLTFSYCYADSRGNEMLRSPFLEELLEVVRLRETKIPVTRVTVEPHECREREELLNSLARRGMLSPPEGAEELRGSLSRIAANAAVEKKREEFFSTEDPTARHALATPHTGMLSAPDVIGTLSDFYCSEKGKKLSPTSLEEYGSCPFRYFLRRLLRLAPVDEPGLEPETREVGTLAHLVLKEFFHRLQKEGLLPLSDVPSAVGILREVATEVFVQWEKEQPPAEPLLWEREKEMLLSLLEQMVAREAEECSQLVPCAFEHRIDPPLTVRDASGLSVEITGVIDRVDVDVDSRQIRIVDYKLAGDKPRYQQLLKKESLGETSFQVPVYLLAAVRDFFRDGAPPELAARFWLLRKAEPLDKEYTDGPKETYSGFFETDPKQRDGRGEDNFLNRLFLKVKEMKNGNFAITPHECGVCDFSTVCRYVPVILREDAGGEPALRPDQER